MAEVTWQGQNVGVRQDVSDRARALRKLRLSDSIFKWLTRSAALLVLTILGGVMVALAAGAWLMIALTLSG